MKANSKKTLWKTYVNEDRGMHEMALCVAVFMAVWCIILFNRLPSNDGMKALAFVSLMCIVVAMLLTVLSRSLNRLAVDRALGCMDRKGRWLDGCEDMPLFRQIEPIVFYNSIVNGALLTHLFVGSILVVILQRIVI